jgi:hypothetical protein
LSKSKDRDIWLLWLGALFGAIFAKFFDSLLSAASTTMQRSPTEAEWFYDFRMWAWAIVIFGFTTLVAMVLLAPYLKRLIE